MTNSVADPLGPPAYILADFLKFWKSFVMNPPLFLTSLFQIMSLLIRWLSYGQNANWTEFVVFACASYIPQI
jgi:hypothetical protein